MHYAVEFFVIQKCYRLRKLLHFGFSVFGNHVAVNFNIGVLLALICSVFHAGLDAKAGSMAALLCVICWVAGCLLATRLGFSLSWKVTSGFLASV